MCGQFQTFPTYVDPECVGDGGGNLTLSLDPVDVICVRVCVCAHAHVYACVCGMDMCDEEHRYNVATKAGNVHRIDTILLLPTQHDGLFLSLSLLRHNGTVRSCILILYTSYS